MARVISPRDFLAPGMLLVCLVVASETVKQCGEYPGFSLYQGADHPAMCLRTSTTKTPYDQAKAECAGAGAKLVTTKTRATLDFLVSVLPDDVTENSGHWVGLDDREEEGKFVWGDGSVLALDSDLWRQDRGAGHLAEHGNRDCVHTWTSQGVHSLSDTGCTSNDVRTTVCQVETIECPEGWKAFRGTCYWFETDTFASWDAAEAACEENGATLAVDKDLDVHTFLRDTMITSSMWIGLTDAKKEGTWVWADGTEMSTDRCHSPDFSKWGEGEPNQYANGQECGAEEDCAQFRRVQNDWNDLGCALKQPFVCQKKMQ